MRTIKLSDLKHEVSENRHRKVAEALYEFTKTYGYKELQNSLIGFLGGLTALEKDICLTLITQENQTIQLAQKTRSLLIFIDQALKTYGNISIPYELENVPTVQAKQEKMRPAQALEYISQLKNKFSYVPNNLGAYETFIVTYMQNNPSVSDPQGTKWEAALSKIQALESNLEAESAKIRKKIGETVLAYIESHRLALAYLELKPMGLSLTDSQTAALTSTNPIARNNVEKILRNYIGNWINEDRASTEEIDLPNF